ncbi:hypothetical protein HDV05_008097 [Chytridiales sp. JEL 0842]|nr:hypothetical protein HDV05_008097 [Chytridiales sp. JEL 0842]
MPTGKSVWEGLEVQGRSWILGTAVGRYLREASAKGDQQQGGEEKAAGQQTTPNALGLPAGYVQWQGENVLEGCIAYLQGDVSSIGDVERMTKTIATTYGPVDYLVNCAGLSKPKLLLMSDPLEMEEIVATNLFGTINMSRALSKGMAFSKFVNKFVFLGFTKSLAKELGPKGVRVVSIAPGLIETEMGSQLPDHQKALYKQLTPLGRFGRPEEVAQSVAFLAMATYVTGETLVVDGGFSA